jgi:hypothetical protein
MRKGKDPDPYLLDPGGPKTCGSGSGSRSPTLAVTAAGKRLAEVASRLPIPSDTQSRFRMESCLGFSHFVYGASSVANPSH